MQAKGKGGRQTERERETRSEPRGQGILGGTACAFQDSVTHLSLVSVGTSKSAAFSTHVG